MVPARPPPMGCLLIQLIAEYGDLRVKHSLQRYPELRPRIFAEAQANAECAAELNRLFPEGLPGLPAEDDPQELEEVLEKIRQDAGL